MGDNCSVYMQIKAAISQMAALLYLSMSSAILRLQIFSGALRCQVGLNPNFSGFSRKILGDHFLSALFNVQKGHNPEKKVTQKNWPWFVGFAEPSDQGFFAI